MIEQNVRLAKGEPSTRFPLTGIRAYLLAAVAVGVAWTLRWWVDPLWGERQPLGTDQVNQLNAGCFLLLSVALLLVSLRLRRSKQEREGLVRELQEALANVKALKGLLPICANCKNIRDDKGYWNKIEIYIRERSEAQFTHGICPECARKLYPHLYDANEAHGALEVHG
jgi:hypothetical protein